MKKIIKYTNIMKSLKNFLILFILSLLIFSFSNTKMENNVQSEIYMDSIPQREHKFNVSITSNKTNCIEGENVWIRVEIINNSIHKDSLADINEYELLNYLEVKDETGKIVDYKGIHASFIQKYILFQPFEKKTYTLDISAAYGTVKEDYDESNTAYGRFYFMQEGKYDIKFEYYAPELKKPIFSQSTTLIVSQPKELDKIAYDELRAIYRMPDKLTEDLTRKSKAYEEFTNKYWNSVYAPLSLYSNVLLKNGQNINYNKSTIDEILKFAKQYPDHNIHKNLLWYLVDATIKFNGGKARSMEILNELKTNYPNTVLATESERLIKSFKKEN